MLTFTACMHDVVSRMGAVHLIGRFHKISRGEMEFSLETSRFEDKEFPAGSSDGQRHV